MERTSYIPVPRESTVMNVIGVYRLYQSLTNNSIYPIQITESNLSEPIIDDEPTNLNPHASNNVAHTNPKGSHTVSHNPSSRLSAYKSKGTDTINHPTIRGHV